MEIATTDPVTGENFRTNPSRDVAYYLPQLVQDIGLRVDYLAKERGLDKDKMQDAYHKFCLFFANAIEAPIKSPFEAMAKTGFFDAAKEYADVIYAATCMSFLGAAWAGLRSSTLTGECPISILEIKRHAREFTDAYCASQLTKEPS